MTLARKVDFCIFFFLALSNVEGACPPSWTLHGGHCYFILPESVDHSRDWTGAREYCMQEGGDLTSVLNSDEAVFLGQLAINQGISQSKLWTGLYKDLPTSAYQWTDGNSYEHTEWEEDEPKYPEVRLCVHTKAGSTGGGEFTKEELTSKVKGVMDSPSDVREGETMRFPYNPGQTSQTCQTKCSEVPACFAFTFFTHYHPDRDWEGECVGRTDYTDVTEVDEYGTSGERIPTDPPDSATKWYSSNCADKKGYICKKPESSSGPSTVPPTARVVSECPAGYFTPFHDSNKCFKVVTVYDGNEGGVNWTQALSICRSGPGHAPDLASIHNEMENSFITSNLQGYSAGVWIGMHVIDGGGWFWSDNTQTTYDNWAEGESYQQFSGTECGEIWTTPGIPGQWNNEFCSVQKGYVCHTYKDEDNPINTPPSTTPHACEDGWTPYWYACYQIFSGGVSWQQAEDSCVGNSGHLVSIHAEAENAATYLMATANLPIWIGFRKQSEAGTYGWSDQWPVRYTRWTSGGADHGGECVYMVGSNGEWNSTSCDQMYNYMCKRSTVAAPTTPAEVEGYCPAGWIERGLYCYYFGDTGNRLSWEESRNDCQTKAGARYSADLASVHSFEENDWIQRNMHETAGDGSYWMCLERKDEGEFTWCDGSPVEFTFWGPGEPSEQALERACGQVFGQTYRGRWNDDECSKVLTYVCRTEKLSNPPSDGDACPIDWLEYDTSCYSFQNSILTWDQANSKCADLAGSRFHGHLVTIHSKEENDWVDNKIIEKSLGKDVWLGMQRNGVGAAFQSVDGINSGFLHWADGEPNSDTDHRQCVEMKRFEDAGQWNDHTCDGPDSGGRAFACKAAKIAEPSDPSPDQGVQCSDSWMKYGGTCYKFFQATKSWQEAKEHCASMSARLPKISDEDENWFVQYFMAQVPGATGTWLGLSRSDSGNFTWEDGSSLSFKHWAADEPDNDGDCVTMSRGLEGPWQDTSCDSKRSYACASTHQQTVPPGDSCCNGGQIFGIIVGVLFGCAVILGLAFVGLSAYRKSHPATSNPMSFNNPLSREDSIRQSSNKNTTETNAIHFDVQDEHIYDSITTSQPQNSGKAMFGYNNNTYDA